jgi:ribosomal protein S18 acetylase RimI-like enzyme
MTGVRIRLAAEHDLGVLAGFEARIAEISFPDDPITDAEVHRKKLAKALTRDESGMFVAEEDGSGEVVGWLWVSLNQNFATGARYAHFRSLFVIPGPDSSRVAERLFEHGLDHVIGSGVEEVIGKVHVDNVPMRLVYRKFHFEPEHLTMRRRLVQ